MSNVSKFITVFAERTQGLEIAYAQALTLRYVRTATGTTLDECGDFVGQPRNGVADDDTYRRYILAKAAVNFSKGLTETLIMIARLVIDDEDVQVRVDNQGAAATVVGLYGDIVSDEVAQILVDFLKKAVFAGVRVVVEYSEVAPADAFYLADAGYLDGAHLAGVTELALETGDSEEWPPAGQVILDEGTTAEETVNYASRDADNLYGVDATANAHDDGCTVTLVDGLLGFCDAETQLNGALAGGEGTVVTDDASDFTATGDITIDAGLTVEDVEPYSAKTGTDFTLTGTVGNAHVDNATVTQGGGALASEAE